jgi:pyridoxamine 5'-phosphate oxidase-like protein
MPSWSVVEAEAPGLAALARGFFDAHVHKTLATLRRDGSPRISATEIDFADGELWLGSMWRSLKALDLRRDPRFALHSGSEDPPDWRGDPKVAGRVAEVTDPERIAAISGEDALPGPSNLFRTDIAELVVVHLGDPPDHIVIVSWHAARSRASRAPLAPDAAEVPDSIRERASSPVGSYSGERSMDGAVPEHERSRQ